MGQPASIWSTVVYCYAGKGSSESAAVCIASHLVYNVPVNKRKLVYLKKIKKTGLFKKRKTGL
jgi:hypothetical protein